MASSSSVPPPLPTAPRPQQLPSYAQFLLDQIRSSLQHLHTSGALDVITYRDVEYKLSRAVLREPQTSTASTSEPTGIYGEKASDSEEVKLGKRNAWMRKAIAETSLLPSLVEAALNIVGGPFLGGSQIDAIVELVTMSQNKIGEAVTNPRNQKAARSGAFVGLRGAGQGVSRGFAAANQSIEGAARRRGEERERKKKEKMESKELEEELKRERQEARARSTAVGSSTTAAADRPGPSSQLLSSGDDEDSLAQSGSATANVAVTTLGNASSAAITTFQPFPGVVISSTIVASPMDLGEQTTNSARRRVMAAEGSSSTLPPLVTSPRSLSAASLATTMMTPASEVPPPPRAPSISEEQEAKLRARLPPPLPPQPPQDPQPLPQPPLAPPSDAQPPPMPADQQPRRQEPLPPPPQHRARPAIGERTLDESERVEDLDPSSSGGGGEEAAAPAAAPADEDDGGVRDTTESKQRKGGWKGRLLG